MAIIIAVLHKGNQNIVERQRAEKALQDAHGTLEIKVQERTQELLSVNEQLKVEVKEREESEKRVSESKALLQSLFDGISDPLILLNGNLRIRMLNEAALKYYQIDQYTNAIGKPCREVILGEAPFSPCDRCTVCEKLSAGKTVFERRGLIDPDRVEAVHIDYVPSALLGPKSYLIRIMDITEEKKAERFMIRADRLASLGQISGGIAHEIRNPLSGISLFVDVLCDPEKFKMGDEELEIFGEIKSNIKRINGIITRVLAFAGDSEAGWANTNVNDLVKESLKFWNIKMRHSEIKLELSLTENIPTVYGDAIGLQQVMNNLIQNAVEAMNNGGLLTISTTKNGDPSYHKNHRSVKIEVEDTGPGILPEQQERIFTPFYSTKRNGTGLGLAISHQIVDRQGGVLFFKSQPGKGSTFTVELPVT
jgi:two-component system, NtrC family, sensor kinase